MWYLFVQASMNISSQSAEQDRLVVQILSARELGVLLRRGENMEIIGEVVTRDGKIYKDSPVLGWRYDGLLDLRIWHYEHRSGSGFCFISGKAECCGRCK
jgi:hypothetical protein